MDKIGMGGGGGGGLTNGACVAQQYVPRPLLIDGFKFDLRLYVLVTACSPLRVYMFHNGLVRLCTKAYEAPDASNLGDHCMHLTNYAINKHSENFVPNEFAEEQDAGSKRSLAWFMEWFAERHGDGRAALLWQRMGFLCTKMLLPILPTLQREYGEVFEKKKKQCGGRLSGDVCKSGDICLGWRDAPLFVVSGAYDGVIIL